jgi:hypothetical protein
VRSARTHDRGLRVAWFGIFHKRRYPAAAHSINELYLISQRVRAEGRVPFGGRVVGGAGWSDRPEVTGGIRRWGCLNKSQVTSGCQGCAMSRCAASQIRCGKQGQSSTNPSSTNSSAPWPPHSSPKPSQSTARLAVPELSEVLPPFHSNQRAKSTCTFSSAVLGGPTSPRLDLWCGGAPPGTGFCKPAGRPPLSLSLSRSLFSLMWNLPVFISHQENPHRFAHPSHRRRRELLATTPFEQRPNSARPRLHRVAPSSRTKSASIASPQRQPSMTSPGLRRPSIQRWWCC